MGSFNGGRIMNKLFKFISVSAFAMSLTLSTWVTTHAAELNVPGFSGSINTTVTSGFSIRTSELDCRLLEGWSYTPGVTYTSLAGEGTISGGALDGLSSAQGLAATVAARGITGTDATKLLKSIDSTGEGCGAPTSDTYGNTTDTLFSFGNDNANDGNLNFRQGDVVDAGQTISLSFTGSNASGIGINLSGVALYNPVLDINTPTFKKLSNKAKDAVETDFKLGNAYITAPLSPSVDMYLGNYIQSQGVTALLPIGVNNVNGFLIGGASLDVEKFVDIINIVDQK